MSREPRPTESPSGLRQTLGEQYECLRKAALGQDFPPPSRVGFAILVGKGMAAWIQACSFVTSQAPSPAPPRPRGVIDEAGVPEQLHGALVNVLATMAVAAVKELPT